MVIIQLCFRCCAHYSELAPEFPADNEELIYHLLVGVVHALPFKAAIGDFEIHYLYPQNVYMIWIDFFLDTYIEGAELQFEGLIGHRLLEFFSKVSVVDEP